MSIYRPEYLKLVESAEKKTKTVVQESPATYQLIIKPFSANRQVSVYFKFVKYAEKDYCDMWQPHFVSYAGNQIDGIDLDNTFYRSKVGLFHSYRQILEKAAEDIIYKSLGGAWGIFRDYPNREGIVLL